MDNSPNSTSSNPIRNIFLVGMPAVGKTHWGSKIAKEYKLPFIDLDVYIAEQEQASISALFAMYGEQGFREREQKYLKKIIHKATATTIVACGGGTSSYNDNMDLMKAAGVVIYLEADIAWLLNNLQKSNEVRPLLNNRGDLAVYLQDLLNKRKKLYEQAHHILQSKDISLSTFAKIISHA